MFTDAVDQAELTFRPPQDETPKPISGWPSEAQRLRLGASRPPSSASSITLSTAGFPFLRSLSR